MIDVLGLSGALLSLVTAETSGSRTWPRALLRQAVSDAERWWRRLGVEPGTAIYLGVATSLTVVVHLLALVKIGAVPVLVPPHLAGDAAAHLDDAVRPGACLVGPAQLPMGAGFQRVGVTAPALDAPAVAFTRPAFLTARSDIAGCIVLLTSGSTGWPKLVVHSAERLLRNAQLHGASIDEERGGTVLGVLPLHFSYGLVAVLLFALLTGKRLVLGQQPFSASTWYRDVAESTADVCSVTPSMVAKFLRLDRDVPASLRTLTIGGEDMPAADLAALRRRFGGRLVRTYGLTEAGPRVMTNVLGPDRDTWHQLGAPLPS
jgi:acyl-CoA synthetase (AMP-forming)/AMP-acid ligase II